MPSDPETIDAVPANAIRVDRTVTDQLIEAWDRSPVRVDITWTVLAAAYLVTFVIRTHLYEPDAPGGLLVHFVIAGVATLAVALRRRLPLPATLVMALLYLAAPATNMMWLIWLPGLIVSYALCRRAPMGQIVIGCAGLTLAIVSWLTATGHEHVRFMVGNEIVQLVIVVLSATLVRSRLERLAALDRDLRNRLARASQDREHRRLREQMALATELHDSVGHALTAVVSLARGAQAALDDDPEAARQAIQMITPTAQAGLERTREVVRRLHQAESPGPGPVTDDALRDLVDRVRAAGQPLVLEISGVEPPSDPLVVSVVREALTNLLRHGDPGHPATLRITGTPRATRVEIRNRPANRPTRSPATGQGLGALANRILEAGGSFEAGPAAGWWVVSASVPRTEGPPA